LIAKIAAKLFTNSHQTQFATYYFIINYQTSTHRENFFLHKASRVRKVLLFARFSISMIDVLSFGFYKKEKDKKGVRKIPPQNNFV
jgi:hypothetical protein